EREYSVFFYMLDYFGQSFIYFSYNFYDFMDDTFGGRISFPSLFPAQERLSNRSLNSQVYSDDYLNTFATFVGSFYKDMGFVKTFVFALGIKVLTSFKLFSTKSAFKLPTLVFNLILMQVYLTGLFYYMYAGTMAFNTFVLLMVLS